ncbi:MAG: hypothetical protein JO149_04140 [Gammaproteobacteria bacterium]|nr:hypothetical protein [Gammaproteobacteria bacterium]
MESRNDNRIHQRDNVISTAFDDGNAEQILTLFDIDKHSLQEVIRNDKNVQNVEKNDKNNPLNKLINNIFNKKLQLIMNDDPNHPEVLIKYTSPFKSDQNIESFLTLKNLSSFNLKNNDALYDIENKYKDSFTGENYFVLGGAKRRQTHAQVENNITTCMKKMPLGKELSEVEIIALTLYTDESFFRLCNALLIGDIKRVNNLLNEKMLSCVDDVENTDEKFIQAIKSQLLKEIILASLFAISAINKLGHIQTQQFKDLDYTFRGELFSPTSFDETRFTAAKNKSTIEQKAFLSSNIGKPADAFNNGLHGSTCTVIVGTGVDLSTISQVQQDNQAHSEKESIFPPSYISLKRLTTRASVPVICLDSIQDLQAAKSILEKMPNVIVYVKNSPDLYLNNGDKNLRKINYKNILSEPSIAEYFNKINKDNMILSAEEFASLFAKVTHFVPTKNFFLAIPCSTPDSLFSQIKSKKSLMPTFFGNNTNENNEMLSSRMVAKTSLAKK